MNEARSHPQALLYVDLLGVRALWHSGGRESAQAAFNTLEGLVENTLRSCKKGDVIEGRIESDSAAIVFRRPQIAIRAGCYLFCEAFKTGNTEDGPRAWIRGVIVPHQSGMGLDTLKFISDDWPVSQRTYCGSLLDAIAAEKSGIRGMRLLIGSFLSKETYRESRVQFGSVMYKIAHGLKGTYPPRLVAERFRDIFWMLTPDEDEWNSLKNIMAIRMRWAFRNPEELVHAGATQAVFNHCGGLVSAFCDQHGIPRRRSAAHE